MRSYPQKTIYVKYLKYLKISYCPTMEEIFLSRENLYNFRQSLYLNIPYATFCITDRDTCQILDQRLRAYCLKIKIISKYELLKMCQIKKWQPGSCLFRLCNLNHFWRNNLLMHWPCSNHPVFNYYYLMHYFG